MFNAISTFVRRALFDRTFNILDILFVLICTTRLQLSTGWFLVSWLVWILWISPMLNRVFWPQTNTTIGKEPEPEQKDDEKQ